MVRPKGFEPLTHALEGRGTRAFATFPDSPLIPRA
jgi:hypothetical protein